MSKLISGALSALMVLVLALPVFAAKPVATGDIAVSGLPAEFGGTVYFDWSVDGKFPGWKMVRISLSCYDVDDGSVIWGQLYGWDYIQGNQPLNPQPAVLGSGGNKWNDRGGGPADCTASLALYPRLNHSGIDILDTVDFKVGY